MGHDLIEPWPVARRRASGAVAQVGGDGQMRQQPGILEHDAAAPPLRRDPHAGSGVQQRRAVQHDPPGLGPQQPGDDAQHGALAGPGRTEQRGDARRGRLERGIGLEGAQAVPGVQVEH